MEDSRMKIKISQIKDDRFNVREEVDKEHLEELKTSLKADGQWDPIIVRPADKGYELIAGHTRLLAAKELKWVEIEANVQDLSDEAADFLSLKTNLMRADMSEIEEGKVIQKMMKTYELTQKQIGDKLGKSNQWVSQRLGLVIKIVQEVQDALKTGTISAEHATLIAQINEDKFEDWEDKQREFLQMIIDNGWNRDETRKQLKWFFNTTIYTIGYEGKTIDQFIKILKDNEIDAVIDIRASSKSEKKPDFNGEILKRSLKQNNIEYEHYQNLGVHFVVQQPYKQGYFGEEEDALDVLEKWYNWNLDENADLDKLVEHFKNIGKCALMCMEKYAEPQEKQKIYCHRHILAEILLKTEKYTEKKNL